MWFKRKNWVDKLLEEDGHIVVLGTTGSGKTNTAKFLTLHALSKEFKVMIIDWRGEYLDLPLRSLKPRISYEFVKDNLPGILSAVERPSSGGVALEAAVEECIDSCSGWGELIGNLQRRSDVGRDLGARAAYRRLLPLYRRRVLTDNVQPIYLNAIYDLSGLPIHARRLAQGLLLAALYGQLVSKKSRDRLLLVVEEARHQYQAERPTTIIEDLLDEVRYYGVKAVIIDQNFREKYLQHTMIIHNLAGASTYIAYRYLIPIPHLKLGEAVMYKGGKVRKIKIPKVTPKRAEHTVI